MNSHTTPVDLARIAGNVVTEALRSRCTIAMATMNVMAQRGYEYGESITIMRMAEDIVSADPSLADSITHHTRRYLNQEPQERHSRIADAQQALEDRAPVIETSASQEAA